MAKYTVKMSCGHEQEVELLGKYSDRRRKIEYFESEGLCKECYKKKMRAQEESEKFAFNVSVLPDIDEKDGSILLNVWFSGNTMAHKDSIKSIGGYRWMERESADDFYSLKRSPLCWNKVIKQSELELELEKAKSIGAESVVLDSGLFSTAHCEIAINKQKEWQEKQDKISNIEKPNAPSVLIGHKWNQKIYGKPGNYCIYPDGSKTPITDEEAEEIKLYLVAKEEYKKKVEEIKNMH